MAAKTKQKVTKTTKNVSTSATKTMDLKTNVPSEKIVSNKSLRYTRKYWVILGVLVLAGALYLSRGIFVAATVNGYPITRVKIVRELEKTSGKAVLENTITKELINQETKKKNITVSDSEVDQQIDEIKKSLESQGTNLDEALKMQGQTMEDLKANIKLQKAAEKLLEDKTKITEDEIKKYFDDNKAELYKDQKYENVRGQIETQLKAQKFQTEIQQYLTDLKNQYKINYFVSY